MPNFWLQLVSAGPVDNCRRALRLRRPGEAFVVTSALLLIVFFMVEGFAKNSLLAHDPAASNWGLGVSQRHCRDTAVFLSFTAKPHHDSDLAARCAARDPAHLRRGGSQLAGVEVRRSACCALTGAICSAAPELTLFEQSLAGSDKLSLVRYPTLPPSCYDRH